MVAMVFMVVLLVALAFYFRFQLESIESSAQDACLVSNTVLLSSVTSMPEIQCSVNERRDHCVDTVKLLVFDPTREYGDLFSSNCEQKVYFTQVYPEILEEECDQSMYPECGVYTFYDPEVAYSASIKISTPVSMYYPLTGEYRLGKLTVEVLQ